MIGLFRLYASAHVPITLVGRSMSERSGRRESCGEYCVGGKGGGSGIVFVRGFV